MARQTRWRKVTGDFIWRCAIKPDLFNLDCKIEIHGAVHYSSVMNRNASLTVSLPTNGKYHPVYTREFYSTWHAKELVDALLTLAYSKEGVTKDEVAEWFIAELESLKVPEQPELTPHGSISGRVW